MELKKALQAQSNAEHKKRLAEAEIELAVKTRFVLLENVVRSLVHSARICLGMILLRNSASVGEMNFEVGPSALGGMVADAFIPLAACKVEVSSLAKVAKCHVDEICVGDVLTALFGVSLVIL